jgi:hypothetical protein
MGSTTHSCGGGNDWAYSTSESVFWVQGGRKIRRDQRTATEGGGRPRRSRHASAGLRTDLPRLPCHRSAIPPPGPGYRPSGMVSQPRTWRRRVEVRCRRGVRLCTRRSSFGTSILGLAPPQPPTTQMPARPRRAGEGPGSTPSRGPMSKMLNTTFNFSRIILPKEDVIPPDR